MCAARPCAKRGVSIFYPPAPATVNLKSRNQSGTKLLNPALRIGKLMFYRIIEKADI